LLGVIRTQELLAARRIDGAEQFFTRAIDFGFTKTPEETLAKWGRDRILSDMVWTIRHYRPDVVILRFSGTPRDGHGQHQASAILGKEAYSAAADKSRYPEQNIEPWKAKRLLSNTFGAADAGARIEVDTAEYNPILGKSYNEIAGLSRSQHRSQAMGSAERRGGPSRTAFSVVAGDPANTDPMDGVDTTWNRLPGGAAVAPILAEAARTFAPEDPAKTIPLLLKARPLIARLAAGPGGYWAALKLRDLDEAIAACAGLWVDAVADKATGTPGALAEVGDAETVAALAVTTAGQAVAIDLGRTCGYDDDVRTEILGPGGALLIDARGRGGLRHGDRYGLRDVPGPDGDVLELALAAQLERFAEACRGAEPHATATDAARALEAGQAMRRSRLAGGTVAVLTRTATSP
jgi:hypothetical protein